MAETKNRTNDSNNFNLWLEEWKECRNSIGRFDQILVEIRKYGFTVIGALMALDGAMISLFKQQVGNSSANATDPLSNLVLISLLVSLLIIGLIDALFWLDNLFQSYLITTAQRAIELEKRLEMPSQEASLPLTAALGDASLREGVGAHGIPFVIYGTLLIVAVVFGFLPVMFLDGKDLKISGLEIVFICLLGVSLAISYYFLLYNTLRQKMSELKISDKKRLDFLFGRNLKVTIGDKKAKD